MSLPVCADFNVMHARENVAIVTNMSLVIILNINSLTMIVSAYKLVSGLWQTASCLLCYGYVVCMWLYRCMPI